MALKKSELYASLWKSCDELRGGMDASQYKDYVLVLLFVKYVSDKASSQTNYLLDVPVGASFADMVALRGDKDIGEKINKIIHRLAEANDLTGVINVADFNDPEKLGRGKEMVDRLSNLIGIFNTPALDFRGNRAEGDDLLGDAYEYLMRHFATESGKSKGQFYTPAEVSRILAKVVGAGTARSGVQTVYDPTCGSGSLLLKVHDEALGATGVDLTIYGQEMDVATAALARMNMILHDAPTAEITPGGYSTLANPQFRNRDGSLKTFDFVVANPPFSNKAWRNGFDPASDEFGRFSAPYVLPPAKNGDFAFLLHIIASLKSTGKGAVILPHGVLFRGNAEAVIRREIVRRGYVKGIIGLPPNLFYGTGIPACIVVLDKGDAATRSGIFMIDASKGFRKDGNKNRLREQDIHRIVDAFTRGLSQADYSRQVPIEEIERNGYNLNLPRYIESGVSHDVQDIQAHLRGGIPNREVDALDQYWQGFPNLRNQLFRTTSQDDYSELCLPASETAPFVSGHNDISAFLAATQDRFEAWRASRRVVLAAFARGDRPSTLLNELSESLLTAFADAPLLDAYDIYQRFMDYWSSTMQDDMYLIAQVGWVDAASPRAMTNGGPVDFVIGRQKFKSDLVPSRLVVSRSLPTRRDELEGAIADLVRCEADIDELVAEHGAEGGLLETALDAKGAISKRLVAQRIDELSATEETDEYDPEEHRVLSVANELLSRQPVLKTRVGAVQRELNDAIAACYEDLDLDALHELVIDDKWMTDLRSEVVEAVADVSDGLTSRVARLANRYATPLGKLNETTQEIEARVATHLGAMGFEW